MSLQSHITFSVTCAVCTHRFHYRSWNPAKTEYHGVIACYTLLTYSEEENMTSVQKISTTDRRSTELSSGKFQMAIYPRRVVCYYFTFGSIGQDFRGRRMIE